MGEIKIEDNKLLDAFGEVRATEDKVVPVRILSSRENSVELQIELHYKGFPPETRNVLIPSSNKLLIEKHLKQIWQELKPTEQPVAVPAEVKI